MTTGLAPIDAWFCPHYGDVLTHPQEGERDCDVSGHQRLYVFTGVLEHRELNRCKECGLLEEQRQPGACPRCGCFDTTKQVVLIPKDSP